MASRGLSLVRIGQTAKAEAYQSADVNTVADIMSRDVTTIHRETPIHQVASVLLEWGLPGRRSSTRRAA